MYVFAIISYLLFSVPAQAYKSKQFQIIEFLCKSAWILPESAWLKSEKRMLQFWFSEAFKELILDSFLVHIIFPEMLL